MQAVIPAIAIKPFIRTLAALSKYGDNVDISATPEHLNLSSINSSKTAYGRIRFLPEFFERYQVDEDLESVNGSVLVKALITVFKNRTSDKTAIERCEITIVPGQAPLCLTGSTSASSVSPQSALVLQFYCKRGVVRTHRLSLSTIHEPGAPAIPASESQASVVVGPRAVKDLIDHFAKTKTKGGGGRGDVPLVWTWDVNEVRVKSLKGFAAKDSDSQIATAITLEADELDEYIVPNPPVVFSFHLREFMAATILAEGLSLQLNISFTEAFDPLVITVTEHTHESLFLIQTKDVSQADKVESVAVGRNKRARESTGTEQRRKKATLAIERPSSSSRPSVPPASARPSAVAASARRPDDDEDARMDLGGEGEYEAEPPVASTSVRPTTQVRPSASSRPRTQTQPKSMPPPPDPSPVKSFAHHATSSAQTMISAQQAQFEVASSSRRGAPSSAPAFSYTETPAKPKTNKQPLFFPFSQSSAGLNSPPTVSQSFSASTPSEGMRIEDVVHAEYVTKFGGGDVSTRSKKPPTTTSARSSSRREPSPDWDLFDEDEALEWTQLDAKIATKREKNFQPLAFDDE